MGSQTHFNCDPRQRVDPVSPMLFAIKAGLAWRQCWRQPARHPGVLQGQGDAQPPAWGAAADSPGVGVLMAGRRKPPDFHLLPQKQMAQHTGRRGAGAPVSAGASLVTAAGTDWRALLCIPRLVWRRAAAEVAGDGEDVCQHGVQVLQLQCPPTVSAPSPSPNEAKHRLKRERAGKWILGSGTSREGLWCCVVRPADTRGRRGPHLPCLL